MFRVSPKCAAITSLIIAMTVKADDLPGGWTLADDGVLSKETSYVEMFDEIELKDLSAVEYLKSVKDSSQRPNDVIVKVDVGEIKDGQYVVQLKRIIEREGVPAHSVLMLCKSGKFENHLIEIYVERARVLDLIAAGKYAIGICAS